MSEEQKPITRADIDEYLTYIRAHEEDFDSFNVSVVQTVLGSFLSYLRAKDEL